MSKQSEYAEVQANNSKEWHAAAKAFQMAAASASSVPSLLGNIQALADAATRIQASCIESGSSLSSKTSAHSVKILTQLSASTPPVLKALEACSESLIAMDVRDKITWISASARIMQARV